jgi:hypothetical protein
LDCLFNEPFFRLSEFLSFLHFYLRFVVGRSAGDWPSGSCVDGRGRGFSPFMLLQKFLLYPQARALARRRVFCLWPRCGRDIGSRGWDLHPLRFLRPGVDTYFDFSRHLNAFQADSQPPGACSMRE